jgi:hypothetical protein
MKLPLACIPVIGAAIQDGVAGGDVDVSGSTGLRRPFNTVLEVSQIAREYQIWETNASLARPMSVAQPIVSSLCGSRSCAEGPSLPNRPSTIAIQDPARH